MDDQELQVLEMQLSEDGRFFFMSEPWVLTGNGQYRIVITAESGLQASTEQHSVRVQVNVPPVLSGNFRNCCGVGSMPCCRVIRPKLSWVSSMIMVGEGFPLPRLNQWTMDHGRLFGKVTVTPRMRDRQRLIFLSIGTLRLAWLTVNHGV